MKNTVINLSKLNLLLLIVLLSFSFKPNGFKNQEPVESFVEFRAKFYSDTLFQKSRILFPMPGIDTDAMEYNDTIYYFQKNEWLFLVDMSKGERMKTEVIKTDTTIRENNHMENSNFDANVFYKLIDKKWFLVRLEIYNM